MGRYPSFLVADYVEILQRIYHWPLEKIASAAGFSNPPVRSLNLERYPNDSIVLRLISALDDVGYYRERELTLADYQYRERLKLSPPITVVRLIIAELFNARTVDDFIQSAVVRFNSLSEAHKLWVEHNDASIRLCYQYFYQDERFTGPQLFFMFLIIKLGMIFNIDKRIIRVSFEENGIRDEAGFSYRTGCRFEYGGNFSFIEIGEERKDYLNRAHNYATQKAVGEALEDLMVPVELDLVTSVTRLLEHNLSGMNKSLDIEATASLLGMSRASLHRRLTEKGQSFRELRSASRLAYASQLLRTTERDIAEISAVLGYSESSAFCRAFKAQHACSPLDYRRACKTL